MAEVDKKGILQEDHVSGMPLPHLSFMMRHFLPMAYTSSNKSSIVQDVAEQKFIVQNADIITSGSTREGIDLPVLCERNEQGAFIKMALTDIDIMAVGTRKLVGEEKDVKSQLAYHICNMHVHHGYTLLKIVNPKETSSKLRAQIPGSEDWYLSAQKSTQVISDGIMTDPGDVLAVKGPAVNYNLQVNNTEAMKKLKVRGEVELVHGLCVPKWPSFAKEWILRKRPSNWPPVELVKEIVSKGCHVVGTGHPHSLHRDLEWRFSFSQAEIILNSSLTLVQKKCYLLFKSLHFSFFKEPKAVATYHLKTTMLWVAEEIPQDKWTEENIASLVIYLLDKLLHFLIFQWIPSYFIPSNNLIDTIPKEVLKVIKQKVSKVRKDPMEHLLIFNDKYKFYFGPLYTDIRTIYEPVLLDCPKMKLLKEAFLEVYMPTALALAYVHVNEHQQMRGVAGNIPSISEYTLPYDHAIDICIDICHMAEKIIYHKAHPAEVIMYIVRKIDNKSVLSLLCDRVLKKFPDAPNKEILAKLITDVVSNRVIPESSKNADQGGKTE